MRVKPEQVMEKVEDCVVNSSGGKTMMGGMIDIVRNLKLSKAQS